MPRYILLLRENPADYAGMTPQAMKDLVARYGAWASEMGQKGKLREGLKLADDGGRHLRRQGSGLAATDGPYAEAKELIGGFFVLEAADYAEVEALAAGCPHLHSVPGNWIEIRAIDEAANA